MAPNLLIEQILQLDSGLLIPASAANGLVLTSDASGNASWATAPANPPAAHTNFSPGVMSPPVLTNPVANTIYYHRVWVPGAVTLTGIQVEIGATGGNLLVAIYDASGTRLKVSASTAVGALQKQQVPFGSTLATSNALYHLAVVFSSATPTIFFAEPVANSGSTAQGSFTTPGSITPPGGTSNPSVPVLSTY